MQILVVGSGGREHAICAAFASSERVKKVICADGNAGIGSVAERVAIKPDEIGRLADLAAERRIDLTFVGPEGPLAMGIIDEFKRRGLAIIGAGKDAARLEASKSFAKDFMVRHNIPTAKYETAASPEEALRILDSAVFGGASAPVVVKADGLAAGKGVVVAADRAEAAAAVREIAGIVGAAAAETIVLEEFLEGREVSLIMFADGADYKLMPPTRDHKRIGEGDTGPNTGGMGTFTDDSLLPEPLLDEIRSTIIEPTLQGCVAENMRFRGILFLGLMLTESGPKVLEYNVRFGDPETQSILVRLETDLADVCEAMLAGKLGGADLKWKQGSSACIVMASEGYPAKPRTGDVIRGLAEASAVEGVSIFHAGTALNESGEVITSGGRVLGVTAVGDGLDAALDKAYEAVAMISWDGMQYRRDIGRSLQARGLSS